MDGYKIPESALVVIYSAALEVLLIERTGCPGFWQSVTGSKATPGEQPVETAIREVEEETGIRIVPALSGTAEAAAANEVPGTQLHDWQVTNTYEIYPSWRYRYAPGVTVNTEHVFGLCVPRDIPVRLSPREHVRYVWLPYQEAAGLCFSSSNAAALRQLPERVWPPA
ncbi:MAG: dihydroneopterin triphosphate diphosphatase [Alistipes senegalensis]|nr:dihydroneopterin triphosphate diphosphatase [Oxalobacter formigenes]MCM1280340.1 dihydroneopterin triphosphate diphosphatase [Alistipes senegalensis]